MIRLTQSLQQWIFENHKDILPSLMFGHVELFTDEMAKEYLAKEYLEWCETEEGEKYLKGGGYYEEDEK